MPDHAGSLDPPTELLLATGLAGGETLSPMWSRYSAPGSPLNRFWGRPQTRNGVEMGLAIFVVGMSVIGADWINQWTTTSSVAGWLSESASVLIIVGALIALALARYGTAQLRLGRARAACFTTGVVVAIPDLLGLLTGGHVIQGMAWDQAATDVATFKPNAFGLFDMHGNLEEVCEDVFHESYEGAPKTGWPAWTAEPDPKPIGGTRRVHRGGWYEWGAVGARSAARSW